MRNIVIIAAKEIKEGLRNRWVLAYLLFFFPRLPPLHPPTAGTGEREATS